MPKMNRLAVLAGVSAALFLLLPPGLASTKKGDKLVAKGQDAIEKKDYDTALDFYQQALATDPKDTGYKLQVNRTRFAAGQAHVDAGQSLRSQGKLDEAMAEFRKAFTIDPGSTIAEQEIRRTSLLIERERRKQAGGEAQEKQDERGLTPGEQSRRDAEKRAATILAVPELKPISRQVTSLKMVNQPAKVLYETLGKLAGINVLFDSEYQDTKRFSIDLSNTTLDEGLDYLALLTKTFVKPLSSNAIFITQDNVTKRRDYEEQVTRVFYLQNLTSPQELQEVMTGMRTVTDVRKVFPINSQSAIVVRGTVDQVALAEKILLDLDKPKSEVVVDLIVMEVSRDKTRNLAMNILSSGTAGLSLPIGYSKGASSSSTTTTTSSPTLSSIARMGFGDWSVTMPSGLLQAMMKDSGSKVLTTPQVRATDGQKASLRLGDKYPYATGSYQSGVGVASVSPLVSTQFQFAEVGVNVDITPRIHATGEVSMQVEFEISNIRDKVDVGGLSQPVIGQRKVSHIIRVKEGELTLIGGLMQATQTKSRSGIPGLVNIPWIGKAFSTESIENINSDLLVALVPHIVRTPDVQPENVRTIATGTETIYKLSYAPQKDAETPKPAAPAAVKPTGLGAGPAGLPKLLERPKPQPEQAPATPPAQAPPAPAAAPASSAALALKPSANEVLQNGVLTVAVTVDNASDLFSAPMRLRYDNKVLRLLEITQGSLLSSDGQAVNFTQNRDESPGVASVTLNRLPGAGGVSGSGTLLNLRFQAIQTGMSSISFDDVSLKDAKLQPIAVNPPATAIVVK